MARRSSGRILAALEGKLGGIRREVSKVLRGLKREIARRESDLAAVKAEFARGMDILRGRAKARPAPTRRRARRRPRRARRVNWKAVFASLPARFTLKTLARHPVAGKRSKPQLYAILSRWKKERALAKDTGGGYRKVTAKPKARRRSRRARPAPAPKPMPRPVAPRPEGTGT
jgi:hypothetical protein